MGSINSYNPKVDTTVQIFDRFYGYETVVDANEYDVVNSFFKSVFKDKRAADNFTVTLFRIAENINTPVLTLLAQLQDQNTIQLTNTLAYYLNGLRSPSTLLGYNAPVAPNYWAARNVLL